MRRSRAACRFRRINPVIPPHPLDFPADFLQLRPHAQGVVGAGGAGFTEDGVVRQKFFV
jgi:hypothetical protein